VRFERRRRLKREEPPSAQRELAAAFADQKISMKRFLNYLFGSKTGTIRNRKPARAEPTLEALEDRTVPVIGSSRFAIPVVAGGSWDGVVQFSGVNGTGTGTLLADGRHILTAAHVVDSGGTSGMLGADGPITVRFDLARTNTRLHDTKLSASVTVPANFITIHPGWGGIANVPVGVPRFLEKGPLPPSKPPPARHRPGARSARRQRWLSATVADHFPKGATSCGSLAGCETRYDPIRRASSHVRGRSPTSDRLALSRSEISTRR
jgi:hypothetical protein